MQSNLSWSSPLCHSFSVSVVLVYSHGACRFYWAILSHVNLFYVQVIKKSWGWKEIVHKCLYPMPSTLQVRCLTVACVAVMLLAECESLLRYTLMFCVYSDSSRSL
jgi:hypothetical protein